MGGEYAGIITTGQTFSTTGTTVGRQRSNAKAVDAQCNPANRQRNILTLTELACSRQWRAQGMPLTVL